MSSDIDQGTLRRIDWLAIFPWLSLFRTFRIAISFRVLWLSVIGVLLTMIMALGVHRLHLAKTVEPNDRMNIRPISSDSDTYSLENSLLAWNPNLRPPTPWSESGEVGKTTERQGTISEVWSRFAVPMVAIFRPQSTWATRGKQALWFLWLVLVWSVAGGMICRTAATRLTCDLTDGFGPLLHFIGRKWRSFFALFLLPTLGMILCLLPCYLGGWLLIGAWTGWLAAIVWPIFLVFSFLVVLIGLGFLLGWPMGFATLATEDSDAFDAVSRVFSYVYQRPIHLLFYLLVAGGIGFLGWWVVSLFLQLTVTLAWQFTPWSETESFSQLFTVVPRRGGAAVAATEKVGALSIVHFWNNLILLFQQAYLLGYFWTASTAIYLLMRRQVDATAMDEIKLFEPAAVTDPPLDPIVQDEQGAPEIASKEETSEGAPPTDSESPPPSSEVSPQSPPANRDKDESS